MLLARYALDFYKYSRPLRRRQQRPRHKAAVRTQPSRAYRSVCPTLIGAVQWTVTNGKGKGTAFDQEAFE
jgi:hypothetical protein